MSANAAFAIVVGFIAVFLSIANISRSNEAAMNTCQLSHSFETCHNTIYN